jgi:hypothetical protein
MRYKQLEDSILIDFFCTVGMPDKLMIEIIKEIETKFNGDYNSDEAFYMVQKMLDREEYLVTQKKDCILNLYPDCLSNKMSNSDPRKNYLDKHKIN